MKSTVLRTGNLGGEVAGDRTEEFCEVLAHAGEFDVERIVSHGQASPPGFWYDQDVDEWVLVVSGAARLRFEDAGQALLDLRAGDWVLIPARVRHRVEWTDREQATIWLALKGPAIR